MIDFFNKYEEIIANALRNCGYNSDMVVLNVSSRPEFGQFQYNGAMALAKNLHKPPRDVASQIVSELEKCNDFKDINIAGPGFINISLSEEALASYINEVYNDVDNINYHEDENTKKKIIIDYGGVNVAKIMHVGHLRSANIGEALKRLAKSLGQEVIADVHLGDWGLQFGMIIMEIQNMFPNLQYFDDNYEGEYTDKIDISLKDLEQLYPKASKKAKEDKDLMERARKITYDLQNGHRGYNAIWKYIMDISLGDIKETYSRINTSFDLWEGESDASKYIPEVINYLKKKGFAYEDQGALIMNVSEEDDKETIPPMILEKSDGAVLYSTTEIATIYSRMKRFNPDEIWYVVDNRQEMHFKQVFRAAYKSGIVPKDVKLVFIGFGTMNGKDGKPFKTREGGSMPLFQLINLVKQETLKRLNEEIIENREKISEEIAISALKYADLLTNRTTDYIFDPVKFSDLSGKTGPYLLYSTIRIRSLLKKAEENKMEHKSIKGIYNQYDMNIILSLLSVNKVLKSAYDSKSLNELEEYIFKLSSIYNNFYSENHILTEQNEQKRESWLRLSEIVYNTNLKLLDILGISVPERM